MIAALSDDATRFGRMVAVLASEIQLFNSKLEMLSHAYQQGKREYVPEYVPTPVRPDTARPSVEPVDNRVEPVDNRRVDRPVAKLVDPRQVNGTKRDQPPAQAAAEQPPAKKSARRVEVEKPVAEVCPHEQPTSSRKAALRQRLEQTLGAYRDAVRDMEELREREAPRSFLPGTAMTPARYEAAVVHEDTIELDYSESPPRGQQSRSNHQPEPLRPPPKSTAARRQEGNRRDLYRRPEDRRPSARRQ